MAKITNEHPLGKKIDRVIYLLESLLALGLNRTNLNRNEIRDRLGVEKAQVNKILDGIERGNLDRVKTKSRPKKTKTKSKKKK